MRKNSAEVIITTAHSLENTVLYTSRNHGHGPLDRQTLDQCTASPGVHLRKKFRMIQGLLGGLVSSIEYSINYN